MILFRSTVLPDPAPASTTVCFSSSLTGISTASPASPPTTLLPIASIRSGAVGDARSAGLGASEIAGLSGGGGGFGAGCSAKGRGLATARRISSSFEMGRRVRSQSRKAGSFLALNCWMAPRSEARRRSA